MIKIVILVSCARIQTHNLFIVLIITRPLLPLTNLLELNCPPSRCCLIQKRVFHFKLVVVVVATADVVVAIIDDVAVVVCDDVVFADVYDVVFADVYDVVTAVVDDVTAVALLLADQTFYYSLKVSPEPAAKN